MSEDTPLSNGKPGSGLTAFSALGDFLQEDGWFPQRVDEQLIYRVGFSGNNGQQVCYARIIPELQQLIFYAVAPVKVPEALRPTMAEFITRANYGLRIGNFEMDYADGELRYKSSLDFEQVTLIPALLRNTLYPAVQTLDRYLPGVMQVLYAGIAPESAIAAVETPAD